MKVGCGVEPLRFESKRAEMIGDDILSVFAVMTEPGNVVGEIKARYGDVVDRTNGGFTFVDHKQRLQMVADLRAG